MLGNTVPESDSSSSKIDDGVTQPDQSNLKSKKTYRKKAPICWFYSRHKPCRFEENCRFRHSNPSKEKGNINNYNRTAAKSKTTADEADAERPKESQDEIEPPKPPSVSENSYEKEKIGSDDNHLEKNDVNDSSDHSRIVANNEDQNGLEKTDESKETKRSRGHTKGIPKKRPCMFFYRFKSCKFGDECSFSHEKPRRAKSKLKTKQNDADEDKLNVDESTKENVFGESSVENTDNENIENTDNKKVENTDNKNIENEDHQEKPSTKKKEWLPTKDIRLDQLTEELIKDLRAVEMKLLEKRFRRNQIKKTDDKIKVKVKPTDPDWPFDVKSVWILVDIPDNYPKEMMSISVPEKENELFPMLLIKYLNDSIQDWLSLRFNANLENSVTELVFRSFLRWFDKNLEKLFEAGLKLVKRHLEAKEAGLEFISFTELQGSDENSTSNNQNNEDQNNEDQNLQQSTVVLKEELEENYNPNDSDVKSVCLKLCDLSVKPETANFIPTDDNKQPKGTAIKIIDYNLSENVASLVCSKVSVVVQCTRCRTRCDFDGLPRKFKRLSCQKCNHVMAGTFRPAMLHQYSATIGYLDLEGCKAFELILLKCEFNATCLNCNKVTLVTGLANGQVSNTHCFICHNKMNISLNTFKFQVMDEPSISDQIDKKLIKKKKELKDPAIQDGKPLPDYGVCKHYKKSFRWFRFPCCGKCYPCDRCHDDKELDHEMNFAIRMLCGYCAKEQTYAADKNCMRCHADLSKKYTGHWDNGKGCRNKVKMSKDDKQKYTGLNKTVSKKIEDKRPPKKPKQ